MNKIRKGKNPEKLHFINQINKIKIYSIPKKNPINLESYMLTIIPRMYIVFNGYTFNSPCVKLLECFSTYITERKLKGVDIDTFCLVNIKSDYIISKNIFNLVLEDYLLFLNITNRISTNVTNLTNGTISHYELYYKIRL